MPFKSSNEIRKCKWCDKPTKKYYLNGRFKGYLKTCGSKECLRKSYKDENVINSKKYQKEKICEICGNKYISKCFNGKWCKNCIPDKHSRTTYERYGLLPNQEKELKEKYNGICPICNKRKASAIDHDHKTGKVRGYICNKCNVGLHYIEDIDLKNNMEKYLKGEI